MKKALFSTLILLSFVAFVNAATYYVSPSGSGTTCSSGSPCTEQQALVTAPRACGDTVLYKSGTYNNTIAMVAPTTCTASTRLVLDKDVDATPILTSSTYSNGGARLKVTSVNYLTIQNLTFSGTANATPDYALWTLGTTGLSVLNNTFQDWCTVNASQCTTAAVMIITGLSGSTSHVGTLVQGNIVTGSRGELIRLSCGQDLSVIGNTITNAKAGKTNAGSLTSKGIMLTSGTSSNTCPTSNYTITDNVVFRSTETWAAAVAATGSTTTGGGYAGIRCDVRGMEGGLVARNWVDGWYATDITALFGSAIQPWGFNIESRCWGTLVRNVITNSAGGIRNTANDLGQLSYQVNNTAYNVPIGFLFHDTKRISASNNVTSMLAGDQWTSNNSLAVDDCTSFSSCANNDVYNVPLEGGNNYYAMPDGVSTAFSWSGNNYATVAAWNAVSSGDTSSTLATTSATTLFVSPSTNDFTPNGTQLRDAGQVVVGVSEPFTGVAMDIGAVEEVKFLSATTTTSPVQVAVSLANIHATPTCTASQFTVNATSTGNQIPTGVGIAGNVVTLTVTTALLSTDTITVSGTYGACKAVVAGNGANVIQARSLAFTTQAVTNTLGGLTAWISGNTAIAPAGANRLLVIGFCWGKGGVVTNPLDISTVTYGGQSCTQSISAYSQPATAGNLSELWYCNEAAIAAASSTTIAWTESEAPNAGVPVAVASGFYTDINQATPITDSDSATATSTTIIATPALTTSNPGIAVLSACSSITGDWTPDSGWGQQIDVGEDETPAARLLVADRTTSGSNVTPGATFSVSASRLVMTGVSLNGGAQEPPPVVPILTSLHTRCEWPELSEANTRPLESGVGDVACSVVPGSKFQVRFQLKGTIAANDDVQVRLEANTNGGEFAAVSNSFDTLWVKYVINSNWDHNAPVTVQKLASCTFNTGGRVLADAMQTAVVDFATNDCVEYVVHLDISLTAVVGQAMVLRLESISGVVITNTVTQTVNIFGGRGSW